MDWSKVAFVFCLGAQALAAGATLPHYYGHPAAADRYGVIAPWYKGQNGQYDYRVRIAAETLKRYPWSVRDKAAPPAPEVIYFRQTFVDVLGRPRAPRRRQHCCSGWSFTTRPNTPVG